MSKSVVFAIAASSVLGAIALITGAFCVAAPALTLNPRPAGSVVHVAGLYPGILTGPLLLIAAFGLLTRRPWTRRAARFYAVAQAVSAAAYAAAVGWQAKPVLQAVAMALVAPGAMSAGAGEFWPQSGLDATSQTSFLLLFLSEPPIAVTVAICLGGWAALVWRAAGSRTFQSWVCAREAERLELAGGGAIEEERPAIVSVAGALCILAGAFQTLVAGLSLYATVFLGMGYPPFISPIHAVEFALHDFGPLSPAIKTPQAWWTAIDTLAHGFLGVLLLTAGSKLLAQRPGARRFALLYALTASGWALAGLTAGALLILGDGVPWQAVALGATMGGCATLLPALILAGWLTWPGIRAWRNRSVAAAKAPVAGSLAVAAGGALMGIAALSLFYAALFHLRLSPFLNMKAALRPHPDPLRAAGRGALSWWAVGDVTLNGLFGAALVIAGLGLLRGNAAAYRLARNYAVFALSYSAYAFFLTNLFPGAPAGWAGGAVSACLSLLPPLAMLAWLSRRKQRWVWAAADAGEHDEGATP